MLEAGLRPATPKSFTLLMATAGAEPSSMRGRVGPMATARKGRKQVPRLRREDAAPLGMTLSFLVDVCCAARCVLRLHLGANGAVEPAVVGGLDAGRAGFHVVLGIEMRARGIGRAGGMNDRQVPLVPERLEGARAKGAVRRSRRDRSPTGAARDVEWRCSGAWSSTKVSACGTTMLRPSAAPRWKITTRRLFELVTHTSFASHGPPVLLHRPPA